MSLISFGVFLFNQKTAFELRISDWSSDVYSSDLFQVDRRTARGYLVKAGEYIQVIDVFGRQCSNFVALDARLLEKGIERGFDMTATRTMTGLPIGRGSGRERGCQLR